MKRVFAGALALALVVSTLTITPALAWHVESGDCSSKPSAKIIEPAGDPWGRIIVRNDRSCLGWVRVPDESWVDGGTFRIDGKVLRAGQRAWLRPGEYVGTWSNTDEVEHVVIRDRAGPVKVVWRGVGRRGEWKLKYTIPNQCVLKTGWQYLSPETMTWVQDRTHQKRMASKRVAKAGWYGFLYKGYRRGIHCPWGVFPLSR